MVNMQAGVVELLVEVRHRRRVFNGAAQDDERVIQVVKQRVGHCLADVFWLEDDPLSGFLAEPVRRAGGNRRADDDDVALDPAADLLHD